MIGQSGTPVPFPSIQDFCFNVPLYESYTFGGNISSLYEGYENFSGQLECFCFECKERSIFQSTQKEPRAIPSPPAQPPFVSGSGMSLGAYTSEQEDERYRVQSEFLTNRLVIMEVYCVRD